MADQSFIGQTALPPGLRNNNPGDIKADGTKWQGAIGSDGTFVIFNTIYWGIRALATDLTTKINNDGLTNITAIISVYAPPSENQTQSYINAVVADTDFGATETLTADPATLAQLVRAIINHEIGADYSAQYIGDDDIAAGIAMRGTNLVTLFQAGVVAVSNNTDNAAWIVAGAALFVAWVMLKGGERNK